MGTNTKVWFKIYFEIHISQKTSRFTWNTCMYKKCIAWVFTLEHVLWCKANFCIDLIYTARHTLETLSCFSTSYLNDWVLLKLTIHMINHNSNHNLRRLLNNIGFNRMWKNPNDHFNVTAMITSIRCLHDFNILSVVKLLTTWIKHLFSHW